MKQEKSLIKITRNIHPLKSEKLFSAKFGYIKKKTFLPVILKIFTFIHYTPKLFSSFVTIFIKLFKKHFASLLLLFIRLHGTADNLLTSSLRNSTAANHAAK